MIGDDVHHNRQGLCRQVMSQRIQQAINLASAPVHHPQATHLHPHAHIRDHMQQGEAQRMYHHHRYTVPLQEIGSGNQCDVSTHFCYVLIMWLAQWHFIRSDTQANISMKA